eukprot:6212549-Pleurochrysis_carterae.AAC.5
MVATTCKHVRPWRSLFRPAILLLVEFIAIGNAQDMISPRYADVKAGATIQILLEKPLQTLGDAVECHVGRFVVPAVAHPGGARLSCTAPPAPDLAPGAVDVYAQGDDGRLSKTLQLTYLDLSAPPTLTRAIPRSGNAHDESPVHVFGSNFAPFSGDSMACLFGEVTTPATFVTPTEVTCYAPKLASRSVPSLTVSLQVTLDGSTFSKPGEVAFTIYNPRVRATITSVIPDSGPIAGGELVEVNGIGFAPAEQPDGSVSRLRCFFGEVHTVATFVSSELVRCEAPAQRGGTRILPLTVGELGGPLSSETRYSYYDQEQPPVVTAAFPPFADAHVPPEVELVGSGFAPLGVMLRCSFGHGLTTVRAVAPVEAAEISLIST